MFVRAHAQPHRIKYWRFNPGQDTIDVRESPRDPARNVRRVVGSVASGRRSRSIDNGTRTSGLSEKHTTTTTNTTSTDNYTMVPAEACGPGSTTYGAAYGHHYPSMKPNDSAV